MHRTYIKSTRTTPCFASAPEVQFLEDKKYRESQLEKQQCNYCRRCGTEMQVVVPAGEDELRHQCKSCRYIEYHNPKTVVGCLVEHEGKVLLCKRALEPCSGLWTLPAGYMELHESSAEGACRETWEEACAKVSVIGPYAHLDIPIIGQVCGIPQSLLRCANICMSLKLWFNMSCLVSCETNTGAAVPACKLTLIAHVRTDDASPSHTLPACTSAINQLSHDMIATCGEKWRTRFVCACG